MRKGEQDVLEAPEFQHPSPASGIPRVEPGWPPVPGAGTLSQAPFLGQGRPGATAAQVWKQASTTSFWSF